MDLIQKQANIIQGKNTPISRKLEQIFSVEAPEAFVRLADETNGSLLSELLKTGRPKPTMEDVLVLSLLYQGVVKHKTEASKLLLNYRYGSPQQTLEVKGELMESGLSPEERLEAIHELRQRRNLIPRARGGGMEGRESSLHSETTPDGTVQADEGLPEETPKEEP
jgi:hypothetical protein